MKRLQYPLLDEAIEFKENIVNILVLESQKTFRDFINQIQLLEKEEESILFFSDDFEKISFSKNVETIYMPQYINFDSKKIVSKIYSNICKKVYDELYLQTSEIKSNIDKYMQEVIEKSEIELIYDEIEVESLLKTLKLRVNDENINLLDKISSYLEIINEIFKINIFIFINLKTFLEMDELMDLYKFCNYKKINLLLCENTEREKLEFEKLILLDEDLCQIY